MAIQELQPGTWRIRDQDRFPIDQVRRGLDVIRQIPSTFERELLWVIRGCSGGNQPGGLGHS